MCETQRLHASVRGRALYDGGGLLLDMLRRSYNFTPPSFSLPFAAHSVCMPNAAAAVTCAADPLLS